MALGEDAKIRNGNADKDMDWTTVQKMDALKIAAEGEVVDIRFNFCRMVKCTQTTICKDGSKEMYCPP